MSWSHEQITELTKVAAPPLATVMSALILATGAFRTAKKITQQMESEKLRASVYQEEQKRRMELYKVLYAERLAVAKQLTDLAGGMYQLCADRVAGRNWSEGVAEHDKHRILLLNATNASRWIITDEVYKTAATFHCHAISVYTRWWKTDNKPTRSRRRHKPIEQGYIEHDA